MKRKGISLLETIVSVQILLIVCLFCMSIFGQGQRHDLRAREFSTCSFLANQKMQELQCTPPEQLQVRLAAPEVAKFTDDFSDYDYNATFTHYDEDLGLLEVTTHSKLGCIAHCSRLLPLETVGRGVLADPNTNRIYYVGATAAGTANSFLSVWNDDSPAALPPTPAHPSGLPLGALSGAPGANFLWALGPLTGLTSLVESPSVSWGSPIVTPTATPAVFWSGLCGDANTGLAIASDSSSRCLRLYDGESGSWNPTACSPRGNRLGIPGDLATDPYGSLVWVADRENNCLRKFLLSPDTPAYPPSLVEPWPETGPVQGFWDTRSFRPGNGFLGTPLGVAMDKEGYAVYVLDGSGIWSFVETDGPNAWQKKFTFASGTRPAGLEMDSFGDVFYVNCSDGRLIKVRPGTPWVAQQLTP